MVNILIGICGVGNGHISRQQLIINQLLCYDVKIVLAVPHNKENIFDEIFPDLEKIVTKKPWIVCDNNGVNFENTRLEYEKNKIDYFDEFLKFCSKVRSSFEGSNPDFVISDYEPIVAQFAYATNIKLICLDQQSKYLSLSPIEVNKYSINWDISLLLYFFPKAYKRYPSSFFQVFDDTSYNIEIIPPIIKNINKKITNQNKVVVYFSPYINDSSFYIKILELLKYYNNFTFYIYSNFNFNYKNTNFKFNKFNNKFDDDLSDCKFIISTAGHQLISEAISLNIPIYTLPLNFFEQHYCAYMVEKLGFGKMIVTCSKNEFDKFIELNDEYVDNMKQYKEKFWKKNWYEVLFKKLESELKITKIKGEAKYERYK